MNAHAHPTPEGATAASQPRAPLYFILADFGRHGLAYVERDPASADWQTTVRDIASGEWRRVVQVIEVDVAAGTCRDVTQRAIAVDNKLLT